MITGNTPRELQEQSTGPVSVTVTDEIVSLMGSRRLRRSHVVQNVGGKPVYLGFGDEGDQVTAATGIEVPASSTWTEFGYTGPVHAVCAGGDVTDVRVVEFG